MATTGLNSGSLDEGARAFNRGHYFEAHELWEAVWIEIADPQRTWVQGLIQLAAGLHKLQRDRPDVCRTLLEKGIAKLHDAPAALDGYALAKLRDDAIALCRRIDSGEKVDTASLTLTLQPPISDRE